MIWEDSVYLVMDIGCLECGCPSVVLSIDDTLEWAKESAQRAANHPLRWAEDPNDEWAWHGDGVYAIYRLPSRDLMAVGK